MNVFVKYIGVIINLDGMIYRGISLRPCHYFNLYYLAIRVKYCKIPIDNSEIINYYLLN